VSQLSNRQLYGLQCRHDLIKRGRYVSKHCLVHLSIIFPKSYPHLPFGNQPECVRDGFVIAIFVVLEKTRLC